VDVAQLALVGAVATAGGAVNAIAGGGSLITFPVLVACGMPAIAASATNTVAMCPGYLGATLAQRRLIADQRGRAARILPAAALGGIAGALLLLHTGAAAFDIVVPFLLVFAVALITFQDRIRAHAGGHERLAPLYVGLAAIYGGYFGAGLGVIVLAVLAVATGDTLVRANALKQSISLAVNVAAAAVFVAIAKLDLAVVGVMAAGSLAGGLAGGVLAARVSAKLLRVLVAVIGLAVAVAFFIKLA
jgi:uncharacterized protein